MSGLLQKSNKIANPAGGLFSASIRIAYFAEEDASILFVFEFEDDTLVLTEAEAEALKMPALTPPLTDALAPTEKPFVLVDEVAT